jgi:hypothetical protein
VSLTHQRRWQFSLRWLLGVTALVAAGSAIYVSFPREVEITMTLLFFTSAIVLPGTPQIVERRPWIGFLFSCVLGPWMLVVALLREPAGVSFLLIVGTLIYLFATYFILMWLRSPQRSEL